MCDAVVASAQQFQIPIYGVLGTLPTAEGIPVAMPADGVQLLPHTSKGSSMY